MEKWVHIHLDRFKVNTNITFNEVVGTLPDAYKPTHTVRSFFNMDYDSGTLPCVILINSNGNATLFPIMPSQMSGTIYSKGIYGDGYYLIQ